MVHAPKRARTIESGACSHCVARRERCYIGVRGIPCSNCRRSKARCDGIASQEVSKRRLPSRVYCDERLFESQIRKSEQEGPRTRAVDDQSDALENYVSIMHQLLGPEPVDRPFVNTPRYVSELPSRLEVSDLVYLENKGAFCLPTAPFRKQLLKSYVLWVHPQVPVLDLENFLSAIAANDGQTRISLLLFHAVMFAASAFVDISHIQTEGYMSRKIVRDVLFRRVKVLLELNCEDDPIATVQALLLLIHWNDLPHSEKGAGHWIGVCLSLAISIGLHRNSDSSAPTSEQRMRRRTWWSVHNHTRLTDENLLSVMRMQEDRMDRNIFDVSMITLSDFQIHVFSPEIQTVVDDCEVLRDIEYQTSQAVVFIEKTRLCLSSRFSTTLNRVQRLVRGEGNSDPFTHLNRVTSQNEIEELRRWQFQLPSPAIHKCPTSTIPTDCERSIYLHQSWLRLLYLGALYAACCHELQGMSGDRALLERNSRYALADKCLLDVTDVLDEVDSLELSEQLPCPTSVLVILALAYHKRYVQSPSQGGVQPSPRPLHKCWKVLQRLKETSDLAARITTSVQDESCDEIWASILSIPYATGNTIALLSGAA